MNEVTSPLVSLLKNRINLNRIPFSERGSRMMVFRGNQHLSVRMAERWFKREGQLSSYRQRRPIIDDWIFTDGEGTPLPFETETYPHRLDCLTPQGIFSITFVDNETLMLVLPPGKCGTQFHASLDQAGTDRRGGMLKLTGEIRRSIAYTSTAKLTHNNITSNGVESQTVSLRFDCGDEPKALLINVTPRLGFNRWVPQPAAALQAAEQRWHNWFAAAPPVAEQYRQQYYYAWWIMRAGLISSRFYTTREAMTPSKLHYVGVWQWDAYFHALAYRYVEMSLAKDQIRILLDHQREDGMIPDAVHDEGTVTRLNFPVEADVTKPPLLAWAAWKLYEHDGDREFIDEIYESVVRCNAWWFNFNDTDGNGLCEYLHPYSSGLDDSPLWDDGVPVEAPDLNTYLVLQQEALSKMAALLGDDRAASVWATRADHTANLMLKHMWDEQSGLFWATRPAAQQRVHVRTPFNLLPMLTGRMPAEVCRRLVDHLTDPRQFWSPYPVPTVALDDPKYESQTMWRGPMWVNVNYLLIEGLERAGYHSVAKELRGRTLDMLLGEDDIYEYYNPQTGKSPPKAASTFGWSSALFIDLAIKASQNL